MNSIVATFLPLVHTPVSGYEKAGFTFEAILKKALFKNGEFMDEIIYVKLKE